ncbi:MAG: hypothetical protein P4L53_01570 [Candidatus Obscuribacterales bacterium]|nr:hypothetical protein [Candidatus Obscuribacterales bacterium]
MTNIVELEHKAVALEKKVEQIHKSLESHSLAPVVVLALNALAIALIGYYFTPIVACKVLFVEITVILSLLCLLIVLFNRIIQNELIHLEVLAIQGQDEARQGLRQGRHALQLISKKMDETFHPQEDTMHELYSNLMPMVQLFITKEKNLLRWGHLSWRVANNVISILNARTK